MKTKSGISRAHKALNECWEPDNFYPFFRVKDNLREGRET
jgi:hypothetical protein